MSSHSFLSRRLIESIHKSKSTILNIWINFNRWWYKCHNLGTNIVGEDKPWSEWKGVLTLKKIIMWKQQMMLKKINFGIAETKQCHS